MQNQYVSNKNSNCWHCNCVCVIVQCSTNMLNQAKLWHNNSILFSISLISLIDFNQCLPSKKLGNNNSESIEKREGLSVTFIDNTNIWFRDIEVDKWIKKPQTSHGYFSLAKVYFTLRTFSESHNPWGICTVLLLSTCCLWNHDGMSMQGKHGLLALYFGQLSDRMRTFTTMVMLISGALIAWQIHHIKTWFDIFTYSCTLNGARTPQHCCIISSCPVQECSWQANS